MSDGNEPPKDDESMLDAKDEFILDLQCIDFFYSPNENPNCVFQTNTPSVPTNSSVCLSNCDNNREFHTEYGQIADTTSNRNMDSPCATGKTVPTNSELGFGSLGFFDSCTGSFGTLIAGENSTERYAAGSTFVAPTIRAIGMETSNAFQNPMEDSKMIPPSLSSVVIGNCSTSESTRGSNPWTAHFLGSGTLTEFDDEQVKQELYDVVIRMLQGDSMIPAASNPTIPSPEETPILMTIAGPATCISARSFSLPSVNSAVESSESLPSTSFHHNNPVPSTSAAAYISCSQGGSTSEYLASQSSISSEEASAPRTSKKLTRHRRCGAQSEKREEKRRRNRLAADKCRRGKIELTKKLEAKKLKLENEVTQLDETVLTLRAEVYTLKVEFCKCERRGCKLRHDSNRPSPQ